MITAMTRTVATLSGTTSYQKLMNAGIFMAPSYLRPVDASGVQKSDGWTVQSGRGAARAFRSGR